MTDLFDFQFNFDFSPVVNALSVTEDAFLPSGGTTAFFHGTINNGSGHIFNITDSLFGGTGVTGDGFLVSIVLMATAIGSTDLSLSNIVLQNSNLDILGFQKQGGSVTVSQTAVPEPGTLSLLATGAHNRPA